MFNVAGLFTDKLVDVSSLCPTNHNEEGAGLMLSRQPKMAEEKLIIAVTLPPNLFFLSYPINYRSLTFTTKEIQKLPSNK